MKIIIAISLGAIIGALGRYYLAIAAKLILSAGTFSFGILLINVLGSFTMGFIVELAALKISFPRELLAFLTVGLLGSFTTFSAFSLEVVLMLRKAEFMSAFLYSSSSVLLSVFALFSGIYLARIIFNLA